MDQAMGRSHLKHNDIVPHVLYGSRGAIEITKQSLPEIKVLRQALKNEQPSYCTD